MRPNCSSWHFIASRIIWYIMSKSKRQGKRRSSSSSGSSSRQTKGKDKQISARTKKQIDSLPEHAQHIYKKAHASALGEYQNPEKRRGGKDRL